VNRALAFDKPDHLRHRVLGRYRNQHVNMIGQQVPFFDSAFLLLRKPAEYFPQMSSEFRVQRLPAALWYEDHMIFALPPGMA
jgi:hypothetical protein